MFAKLFGWAVAHKDAFYAGYKLFKALRGRRKETQQSGEPLQAYHLRVGRSVVRDIAKGY